MERKKKLGSFYTPKIIADWIVKRVLSQKLITSVLEPSCGDGAFISSLYSYKSDLSITAIDIDDIAIKKVCQNFSHVKTINQDFLFSDIQEKFDLIIGNPPYISKKNISQKQIEICRDIHVKNGLEEKEISNMWTAFVVKSCLLVKPTGVLAFVLPAEFLQVKYAKEIRDFIVAKFTRIEILSFRNFRFENTEQNTIVLIAYKDSKAKGVFFKEFNSVSELNDDVIFQKSSLDEDMKWTANCLTVAELNLIKKIKNNCAVHKIEDYCSAVAGIVTAANSYFIVDKNTMLKYNLKGYIKPIIQKSYFVDKNISFNKVNFQKLIKSDYPCFLLDLSSIPEQDFNPGLKNYLQLGVQQEINKRYKCKQRERWYDIPSIWSSEGFFFKRADKYPKMLVNTCGVYVTDSAYRIKMKKNYSIKNLVYSFYNTYTLLMAEIMGRSYGGGVLELTPNEFKSLPIIYIEGEINFNKFSCLFNAKNDINDILQKNDEIILKSKLDLTVEEIKILHNAYDKIKKRRIS